MRILVADDETGSRLIARLALGELGHECQVVADGAEAWDAFLANPPDVVISDWMMPELSGLELCHRIRTHPGGGHPYIILLTSHSNRERAMEGMRAGADDYLVKPLDRDELHLRLIAAERVSSLHRLLARQRAELELLNGELVAIARQDALTGLGNRRALDEDLELLEARVRRYGHRYCIAIFDVDLFKAFNDAFGHPAGDRVLRNIADNLRLQARAGDGVYRYGGEEFLCIFPEQELIAGVAAAQRMRESVERLGIHTGDPGGVLTLSAGLAMLDRDVLRPVAAVLKEADEALYRAKRLGRNRVEHGQGGRGAGPRRPEAGSVSSPIP